MEDPLSESAATFTVESSSSTGKCWGTVIDALPVLELPDPSVPIVVIAAHPDDETLGVGGTIARAARRGHRITVIMASDGEASHPDSPTHRPPDLAALRRRETDSAVGTLAPAARIIRLGLPDGQLPRHLSTIATAVSHTLGAAEAPPWVFAPWQHDRHPDHAACALAVARATADCADAIVWEYPIWAWYWADPQAPELPLSVMRRILLDDESRSVRVGALAEYRSQVRPLSSHPQDRAVLPADFLRYFDRSGDVVVAPDPAATHEDYFASKYERSDDPWGLGSRWYEERKRALLLASLPRRRFRAAFEPGCAAGLLTKELAARCDSVLAADVAERAVDLSRLATSTMAGVRVERLAIPQQWPLGPFDLVVLAEVGYYADDPDELAAKLVASLTQDGVVMACHWRHPAVSHPSSAQAVHQALHRRPELHLLAHHEEEDFLLDVFDRAGVSVARADGIVA